ncbi:DUF2269 domain-containing protein [Ornithinimicrobium cavernae]|uniref:DUF2269 domain-containing protein n=1 Tax=Ornithinimicrobium cavernae TaxID=2666047 RepID=UPI00192A4E95|nr:DUF2269 domain-containing protein [Ornithinimicrobium cavernae]
MLTVHIAASVGWMGAIVAYVALNVPALTSPHPASVRAAHLMMEPVALYAVTPLAIVSLLTGVALALGTVWGLFRHYWVVISLVITVFATTILLLHLPTVSALADRAADPRSDVAGLTGDMFHAVAGLAVLMIPLVLNIYKPRGLTRYGWRAQQRQSTSVRRVGPPSPDDIDQSR